MSHRGLHRQRYAIAAPRSGKVCPVRDQQLSHLQADRLARPINGVTDAIRNIHRSHRNRSGGGQFRAIKLTIMSSHHGIGVHGTGQLGDVVSSSRDHRIGIYRPPGRRRLGRGVGSFAAKCLALHRFDGGLPLRSVARGKREKQTQWQQESRGRDGHRTATTSPTPGLRRERGGFQIDNRRFGQGFDRFSITEAKILKNSNLRSNKVSI
jgi:hypothetical protein